MLEVYVEHYTAQHAGWSPAAAPDALGAENAADFVAGTDGAFDPTRSVVPRRDGAIVAQGLVWPDDPHDPAAAAEVTPQAAPHAGGPVPHAGGPVPHAGGPVPHAGGSARTAKEACLAAVIDRSADDDPLYLDAHLTEREEIAIMDGVPGPPPHPDNVWMAIVAIPVRSGPAPIPLPTELVLDDAAWLREFLPGRYEGA